MHEGKEHKNGSSEDQVSNHDPAETRSQESETLFREAYAQAKNKTNADLVASATGCRSTYPLAKLPGHNRLEESVPDACHTVKDVVQNIMNIITSKNVNTKKIIDAETALGRLDLDNVSSDPDNERRLHIERYAYDHGKPCISKAGDDNDDDNCSDSKKT